MSKYKVVFKDGDREKLVFGKITFENDLVKVDCDLGNTVYINRANIIFIKEIKGGIHYKH